MIGASEVLRIFGGHVTGTTKLHKSVYIMEVTGQIPETFNFMCVPGVGPFSEDLETAMNTSEVLGDIAVVDEKFAHGIHRSYFSTVCDPDPVGAFLVSLDSRVLVLLATMLYVRQMSTGGGSQDAWREALNRLPAPYTEYLYEAKVAYRNVLLLIGSKLTPPK